MVSIKSKAELEAEKKEFVETIVLDNWVTLPLSVEEQKRLLYILDSQTRTLEETFGIVEQMDNVFWEALYAIRMKNIYLGLAIFSWVVNIAQAIIAYYR